MKKPLVNEIKSIAAMLPEKYEVTMITSTLSGADANLTVVGPSVYDVNKNYQFETPVFMRVNHESRLKDGVKRYGQNFINEYIKKFVS